MREKILFTGFPGFIGRRLIKDILKIDQEAVFYFLVLPSFVEKAKKEINQIDNEYNGFSSNAFIFEGDITKEDLGLSSKDIESVKKDVTMVFHLAAIYDLAVPREPAFQVNVIGTKNVLRLCSKIEGLKRLVYFSTCYVSGDRTGLVREDELEMGQSFKNYYEETKYLAEVEVRRSMKDIPTSIIRPAIVVGDSKTGETIKYDGPYYAIRALMFKLPRWLPLFYIGKSLARVNIVPVDFVTNATSYIAFSEKGVSKTFQLADPNPITARELWEYLCQKIVGKRPSITFPAGLIEFFCGFKFVSNFTGIPKEAIPYFNHNVTYDVTNTLEILEGTGITCPGIMEYLDIMVQFVKEHPDL